MPMNCYLITIGRPREDGHACVAIEAPTAQDAITVADVAFRTVGYDAEGNGLHTRHPDIRGLQCLGEEFVKALPQWKRTGLRRYGHVAIEEKEIAAMRSSDPALNPMPGGD